MIDGTMVKKESKEDDEQTENSEVALFLHEAGIVSQLPLPLPLMDDHSWDPKQFIDNYLMVAALLAGDTYVWRNIFLAWLSGQINNDADHTASIALIITYYNIIVIWMSVLFSMNIVGSPIVGELEKEKNNPVQWEKKRQDLVAIFRNGLILSVPGVLISILLMLCSGSILHTVFGQDKYVSYLAADYLAPSAISVPFVFFWMCGSQMISCFNYPKIIFVGSLTFGIGLFLAAGLSSGKMGMPSLGIKGLLIGYNTEACLTALAYGLVLKYEKKFRELQLFNIFKDVGNLKQNLSQLLKISMPMTANIATEMIFIFYLSLLSGWQGRISQEALALVLQYVVVCGLVAISCSIVNAMNLGRLLGEGKLQRVYPTTRHNQWASMLLCCIIPAVCAAYPQLLMHIFNHQDKQVEQSLQSLAPLMSAGLCCDAFFYIILTQTRVLGARWSATTTRVASLVFGAILATCLNEFTDLKVLSIGIGYLVAMFSSAFTINRCFNSQIQAFRKEHKVVAAPNFLVSTIITKIGFLKCLKKEPEQVEKRDDAKLQLSASFGG